MKLVSFGKPGSERAGILREDGIIDVAAAVPTLPSSVRGILAADAIEAVGRIADTATTTHPIGSVRLGPPVPDPTKIICLGLNYRDHAVEQGKDLPGYPLLFSKGPNVLCGDGDGVPYPLGVEQFDYEVELAFVIGRRASRVTQDAALDHVAGYCVFIDLTARDLQRRERQWFRAKSVDNGGPCGPYLVTRDDVADPHNLAISLEVNGETLQRSNTREMTFTVDFLVHHISQTMTLEPGDIVATGTPPGVGVFRDPPRFLEPGDRIAATIDGLGTLHCEITR